MTITWQTIITFSAVIAAVAAVMRYYNKAYDLVRHQREQDERIAGIETRQRDDIQRVKEEQRVLTKGMLACLQGLQEQGCDGPVSGAIDEIETFLNDKAHR